MEGEGHRMELPQTTIVGHSWWCTVESGVYLPGAFGEGLDLCVVIRHSPCFNHSDYKVEFAATAYHKRHSLPSAFPPFSSPATFLAWTDGKSHLCACWAALPTLLGLLSGTHAHVMDSGCWPSCRAFQVHFLSNAN